MIPVPPRRTGSSIALVVIIGIAAAAVLAVRTDGREPAEVASTPADEAPERCAGGLQAVAPAAPGDRTRLTGLPAGRRLDARGAQWHGRQA